MKSPEITGAILAGGRGSRMGGADKGLIELDGKPLIAHLIEALRPQVNRLLINANRNIEQYAVWEFPVIEDEMPEFQGPLAGVASLLEQCETDWLVTVPCDAPHLPEEFVTRLWAARENAGALLAIAHDGHRLHPAHALLSRQLLPDIRAALKNGDRAFKKVYARFDKVIVDFSDQPDAFINLNTPEDHQRVSAKKRQAPQDPL